MAVCRTVGPVNCEGDEAVGPRKRRFRPAQSHSPTVEACSAAVRLLFGCYSWMNDGLSNNLPMTPIVPVCFEGDEPSVFG